MSYHQIRNGILIEVPYADTPGTRIRLRPVRLGPDGSARRVQQLLSADFLSGLFAAIEPLNALGPSFAPT